MRIIVIEVDSFQRMLLIRMIKRVSNVDIIGFSSVDDCLLELSIVNEPVVIFTDVNLPNKSALTLFRELKKNIYIIGLIVVSTLPEAILESINVLIKQLEIQFTNVINKPLNQDDIKASLHPIESFINSPSLTACSKPLTKEQLQLAKYENSFHPYFQPQVNIKTGNIHGLEVLGRIITDGKLMLPGTFIQPLSQHGMMSEYTLSIVARAIHLLSSHGLEEHNLSINVEYCSLQENDFAEKLLQVLRESNYPARKLTIEVTESKSALSENVLYNLTELKLNCVSLSIDNFGNGSSNIDELLNVPFSELKIDNRYTEKMITNAKTKLVNNSISHLCLDLNINCIAQGVETEQQVKLLQELEIPIAQGYYFSYPIPAPELRRALAKINTMMGN